MKFLQSFPPRLLSYLTSVSFLSLSACSTMTPDPPRNPEASEKLIFDAFSSFYCRENRWPKSWDEVTQFSGLSSEQENVIGEFLAPSLESPRAILMVLRYRNIQGADRKVIYIAPPECAGRVDPAKVSMVGGRVSFKRQSGFTPLDSAAIKAKWRNGPYPDVAWQDQTKSIFVTVSFGDVPVENADLGQFKEELDGAYEASLPGIAWIEKSLAGDEEPPKIVHIFSSDTNSGRSLSYNISLSFEGRLLTLGVTGSASRQGEIEDVGDSIRRTISLR